MHVEPEEWCALCSCRTVSGTPSRPWRELCPRDHRAESSYIGPSAADGAAGPQIGELLICETKGGMEHVRGVCAEEWGRAKGHIGSGHADGIAHQLHWADVRVLYGLNKIALAQVAVCPQVDGVVDGAARDTRRA